MKRITEIDLLRALATILLLFHHSGIYQLEIEGRISQSIIFIPTTYALLGIFIFLSGYLLGYSWRNKEHASLWTYYARRITRLYPPYLLSLLLFSLLLQVKLEYINLWAHLFGFQIILAPIVQPIFTLWYFGLLIAYLLVVPVGYVRFKKPIQVCTYLVVIFTIVFFIHQRYRIVDARFFYYFWVFSIGSLIGAYSEKLKPFSNLNLLILAACVIFILAGIRVQQTQIVYFSRIHWKHIVYVNAYIISGTYLAYQIASRIKKNPRVVQVAEFISKGSYFTYIYHRPLFGLLLLLIPATQHSQRFLAQLFIGLPVTLLVSGYLQPLYQRVIIKYRDAHLSPTKPD
jgi:peptidoglycan/LPS O-acetylase OafA/YrhL